MNHNETTGNIRRKLTDILNGGGDSLRNAWADTKAATDFTPLPAGVYVCRIVGGELDTAKTGTPGYKLTFKVLEGEHEGRRLWHDVWLTSAAIPMAKRDLGKLGVTQLEQLESPLPEGIRASVKVTLRKDDDGTTYNRVRGFDVLGIDPPPPECVEADDDPDFAPGDDDNPGDRDKAEADAPAPATVQSSLVDAPASLLPSALEGGR